MTPLDEGQPSNTPTDPQNAKPTQVRQGRRMPGMLIVLAVSLLAIGLIYVVTVAMNVGANEDDQAADSPPSELLDDAPPDIGGAPQ